LTLRGVHIIFVAAVVFLTMFFGYWALQEYERLNTTGYLVTAIISFLCTVAVIIYGVKFSQKVKIIATTFILASLPKLSYACAVCFKGDPQDPMNQGLRAGILVLLVILTVMLGLFARFFISLGRRAKMNEGH